MKRNHFAAREAPLGKATEAAHPAAPLTGPHGQRCHHARLFADQRCIVCGATDGRIDTRDREWCEWLKAIAEETGEVAYLAEHDVRPGTNLAEKVTQAIDKSDAVCVRITDNSVTVPDVHQEIG